MESSPILSNEIFNLIKKVEKQETVISRLLEENKLLSERITKLEENQGKIKTIDCDKNSIISVNPGNVDNIMKLNNLMSGFNRQVNQERGKISMNEEIRASENKENQSKSIKYYLS